MIICVTGPMAAGKNAASAILEKKGFASIDADQLGHKAVELSKDEILKEFSQIAKQMHISLVNSDGSLNRKALGQVVFSNPELLKKHESIVFPKITSLFNEFLESHKNSNIVLNATVLYKIPLINIVDHVIYVDCPKIIRLFRAKKRDSMKISHILGRFKAQKHLFAKYKKSVADTRRVWNVNSLNSLEKKIDRILQSFSK